MHYITLIIITILFISAPSFAESTLINEPVSPNKPTQAMVSTYYGLAMHGNAKYHDNFEHLDYVNPDAPKGGSIRYSAIGTFDSVNPYAIKGKAAKGLQLYYDRLMARVWDEPFTMYPLVAEKVEIPEDRSSFTVHINPNARFHDKTPITAEDVLFSFETLRDHGRPNMRSRYSLVKTARITNEHTVHFEFGEGYDRETVMILAMMPVLSKAWWENREFNASTLDIPLSSGPYKISEIDPGRRIIYERDPDYWAKDLPVNVGHYNFDTITYDYFRDDLVALQTFKSGDIDLRTESDAGKWIAQYNLAEDSDIIKEQIAHQRPERVRSLIFNTRRPPFDSRDVRQALSLLFDFHWVNKNLYHDQYQRIQSYFPNSILEASGKPTEEEIELLSKWKKDLPPEVFKDKWTAPSAKNPRELRPLLKKADKLLTQAGWIAKKDKRFFKNNPAQTLSFEILTGSPESEKIILHYIRSLKRLGIEARIRVMDSTAFQDRLRNYDFDMLDYYWQNSLSPGSEQSLYWSCKAASEPSRWNFAGICSDAVDGLAKGIADAKTYNELKTHAHALDRILTWQYYAVPLYYAGHDNVAYRDYIQRPQKTPIYGMVLETWWAKPSSDE